MCIGSFEPETPLSVLRYESENILTVRFLISRFPRLEKCLAIGSVGRVKYLNGHFF